MALNDRFVLERIIALAEEGGLSASIAGELYVVPKSTAKAWLQKYWMDGQVGRPQGTGLWRVCSTAQDAAFVAKAQRNPFSSTRDPKSATGFPVQKSMVISRLKEAGHGARHAMVKELHTDE
jgi:transposase-like protein